MKNAGCLFIILTWMFLFGCNYKSATDENVISRFTVNIGEFDRNDAIASLFLDGLTAVPDSDLTLYEVREDDKTKIEYQIDISSEGRFIYWVLRGESEKGTDS
jgi:hypothetical protein